MLKLSIFTRFMWLNGGYTMKKLNITLAIIGFAGLLIMSIAAIINNQASDMLAVIVVQLMFASLFVAGMIGINNHTDQ